MMLNYLQMCNAGLPYTLLQDAGYSILIFCSSALMQGVCKPMQHACLRWVKMQDAVRFVELRKSKTFSDL